MAEACVKLSSTNKEYTNIQDVFEAGRLRSGDTITLLDDITLGQQIVVTKKCTWDLNGHFIFIPIVSGLLIKDGAAVTIDNGKIQTLSSELIEDSVMVQGSKTVLTLGSNLEVATHGTSVHARRRGNLVIDGASVRATGIQPTIRIDDTGSTLEMNSGIVASYEKNAIVVRNGGVVTIHGGKVFTESNGLVPETTYPTVIVNGQGSKLVVKGGDISSEYTRAITVQAGAELDVESGIICSKNDNFTAIELQNGNTTFYMKGGWVYSTMNSAILSNKMEAGGLQTISVEGGKIGAKGDVVFVDGLGDHGVVFGENTYVKGNLPQEFIAPGYVLSDIKDEEGYAQIILKTWVQQDDIIPDFEGDEPEENPFDHLIPIDPADIPDIPFVNELPTNVDQDTDEAQPIPFPPEDIAGNNIYTNADPKNAYFANQPIVDSRLGDLTESENKCIDDEVDNTSKLPEGPDALVPTEGLDPNFIPQPDPNAKPGPLPELGPAPGPAFPPKPEDVPHVPYNSSVNVQNKIYIYKTPSRKTKIAEWRGALTIVEGGYMNGTTSEEFALVKFRIPGSGQTATGYASIYDISNP